MGVIRIYFGYRATDTADISCKAISLSFLAFRTVPHVLLDSPLECDLDMTDLTFIRDQRSYHDVNSGRKLHWYHLRLPSSNGSIVYEVKKYINFT